MNALKFVGLTHTPNYTDAQMCGFLCTPAHMKSLQTCFSDSLTQALTHWFLHFSVGFSLRQDAPDPRGESKCHFLSVVLRFSADQCLICIMHQPQNVSEKVKIVNVRKLRQRLSDARAIWILKVNELLSLHILSSIHVGPRDLCHHFQRFKTPPLKNKNISTSTFYRRGDKTQVWKQLIILWHHVRSRAETPHIYKRGRLSLYWFMLSAALILTSIFGDNAIV